MKGKEKKSIKYDQEVNDISRKVKKIFEEIDYIKKSNILLTAQIQELMDTTRLN